MIAVLGAALTLALMSPIDRYALIIGYNGAARDNVQPLHFADDDALAMAHLVREAGATAEVLTRPDDETAALLTTAPTPPTMAALSQARDRLFAAMRDRATSGHMSELIIFYSGHGEVENGEGYLLLEDGRLTRHMLFEQLLAASPASTNHVIIDACKSSYLTFEKGVGGSRRVFAGGWQDSNHFEVMARTGFLLSTSTGRDSHEWERFQSGVFSHEVLSALRGAADVNADGAVDYAELGGFLASANRTLPNARYRPDFLVRPPGVPPGDLLHPLLVWSVTPNLWLDGRGLEHVYIESPSGERLADVHPAPSQVLPLHLPRARPLYVRDSGDTHERVISDDAVVTIGSLEQRATTVARKGALAIALEQLFSAPFDRLDVDRFAARYDITTLGIEDDEAPPFSARAAVHTASVITAGVGAAAGTGLLIAAHVLANNQHAAQVDRPHINDEIHALNTGGIVALAIAGAAAIVWELTSMTAPPAGD